MKARIFAEANRKWWTLAALSFALFMIMLDNTIVNVALPSIQRDLAIGPLVGGLITEHIGWNWIFYVNVPVGVLGVVATLLVVPESRDTSHEQRLDLPGMLVSGAGLLALAYALIEGNHAGWSSPTILSLFALAAVALVAFVLLELHQRLPMMDLSLFRQGTFAGANIVALLVSLAMFGVFFFVSLYMQNILGYSAVEAGATFLPMTVLIILVAPRKSVV